MAATNQAQPLVTRPQGGLPGCVWFQIEPGNSEMEGARLERRSDLSLSVGSLIHGPVTLSVAFDGWNMVQLHLSPADALELASRLLRMAAAVHEQSEIQ